MIHYDGLQRTFSKEYTSILRQRVKQGMVETYLQDIFPTDEGSNNIYRLQQQMHHDVKLEPEKTDFENAKIFFDAYKDLSPIIASEEAFWAHMTHEEHFEYVKKRWNWRELIRRKYNRSLFCYKHDQGGQKRSGAPMVAYVYDI